jgi:outer membrane protein
MNYNLKIINHTQQLESVKKKKEMKMRKTIVLVMTILVLTVFVFSEVKIGVINAQLILEKTKKGLDIQKKLEKFQEEKKQQMQKMQDEIEKLRKDLMSPALNTETRDKKTLDLQTKQKELKRFYEDAQNEFQRESQKELVALEKELMPLIENLGRSKGYSIIFDITKPGIVYYDNTIDITAEIIKAVDAKYPN